MVFENHWKLWEKPLQMEVSSENNRTLAGGFSTFHKPGGALARAGYTHREGHGKPETYHDWGVRVAIKRVTWIDLGDGF